MQPKKQLKVQYIGIFEEIDSFYWPKMHLLKEGQKIRAWVDPSPPSFGQCPKENVFFALTPSLSLRREDLSQKVYSGQTTISWVDAGGHYQHTSCQDAR